MVIIRFKYNQEEGNQKCDGEKKNRMSMFLSLKYKRNAIFRTLLYLTVQRTSLSNSRP